MNVLTVISDSSDSIPYKNPNCWFKSVIFKDFNCFNKASFSLKSLPN